MTRVLAAEWGKYNIHVNVISPGLIITSGVKGAIRRNPGIKKIIDAWEERAPLRRSAEPKEIASVVVFLVSSESGYITGQELIVDGGMTVLHPGTTEIR